jgi:uncharacterized membrane protein YkoI
MRQHDRLLLASILMLSAIPSRAAGAKTISLSELPPNVRKTAQEQSKGATVMRYDKETEKGQIEYEVEMIVNGHSRDVAIAPDGAVTEVEEEVEMIALPAEVQKGLRSRAGDGTIKKVESITKRGSLVAYEAQIKTAGRHREIQVGPDGKPLDHEE